MCVPFDLPKRSTAYCSYFRQTGLWAIVKKKLVKLPLVLLRLSRPRSRNVQRKTSAYVKNNDFGATHTFRGSRVGVATDPRRPPPGTWSPAESDYGSDSDLDAISHRNQMATAAAAPQGNTPGRRRSGPFADSDSDIGGVDSDSDSDVSYDALRHPAFPRRSNGHDEDDFNFPPEEIPRARGTADWMEVAGRYLMEAESSREGESGDSKARRLEREREHLTREVHQLSAQLASSGVTTTSAGSPDPPEGNDHQRRRFFASPVTTPAVGVTPARTRGRQQEQAAMAAATAAEAAEEAVAAVEKVAKNNAAPRRRQASRGQGSDGGDVSARRKAHGGSAGHGNLRHRRRQSRENAVPNKRGRSPVVVLSDSSSDCSSRGSASSGSGSGSPSWRLLPRRPQESPTPEEVFHSQPQRQRQRREREREREEVSAQQDVRTPETGAFFPWGQVRAGMACPKFSTMVSPMVRAVGNLP